MHLNKESKIFTSIYCLCVFKLLQKKDSTNFTKTHGMSLTDQPTGKQVHQGDIKIKKGGKYETQCKSVWEMFVLIAQKSG